LLSPSGVPVSRFRAIRCAWLTASPGLQGGKAEMNHTVFARKRFQPLWIALIACLIGAVVLLGYRSLPLTLYCLQHHMPIPYFFPDSEHYVAIAEGHISEVASPYSKRVLFPWMAGELAREFSIRLDLAFLALNFFAFIVLAYCSAALLQRLKVNPWWILLMLVTPLPLECLQRAFLPDLFHMALLSIFLLLVACDWAKSALVVLFLAFLARDNTLILCLVACYAGWRFRDRLWYWGGMIVLTAGLACESLFVRLGQPNRHHLPELLYMALFVPCSFLGNIFGIVLWTNTGGEDGIPLLHWHIPPELQIGADHDAYLGYDQFRCIETFAALFTVFGCGPIFLFYLWKKLEPFKSWPLAVQLAFAYGLISYFLGLTVGRSGTFRLIGYAWPLYWIALPYFLSKTKFRFSTAEIAFLILASLVTAWIPNLEGLGGLDKKVTFWLLGVPFLYGATAICFCRIMQRGKVISKSELPP
jgi:hypothetical protein